MNDWQEDSGFDLSVVIPCYNAAETLRATVESVAGPYRWEVIIVDDGSTDDSISIARQLADEHPQRVFVIGQANAGQAAARNTGIRLARGRYLYFLDADDLAVPNFLQQAIALPDADANAPAVQGQLELLASHRRVETWQLETMARTMTGTVVMRADIVRTIGGFPVDPAFRGPAAGEDGALRHELSRFGKIIESTETAVRYRMRPGNHVDLFLNRARFENGQITFTHLTREEQDGSLSAALSRYRRSVAMRMLARKLREMQHRAEAAMHLPNFVAGATIEHVLLHELAAGWPAPGEVVALELDAETTRWLRAGCEASQRGNLLTSIDELESRTIRLLVGNQISGAATSRVSRDGLIIAEDERELDANAWMLAGTLGTLRIFQRL